MDSHQLTWSRVKPKHRFVSPGKQLIILIAISFLMRFNQVISCPILCQLLYVNRRRIRLDCHHLTWLLLKPKHLFVSPVVYFNIKVLLKRLNLAHICKMFSCLILILVYLTRLNLGEEINPNMFIIYVNWHIHSICCTSMALRLVLEISDGWAVTHSCHLSMWRKKKGDLRVRN